MEIEKIRETSWKIQLKNKSDNIEITSVEISGEVRIIKLGLISNVNAVKVEMNKEEFFNFLSLMSAFKDVVIGEESILMDEESDLIESGAQQIQETPRISDGMYQINIKPPEENIKNDDDELNPEEWDPW